MAIISLKPFLLLYFLWILTTCASSLHAEDDAFEYARLIKRVERPAPESELLAPGQERDLLWVSTNYNQAEAQSSLAIPKSILGKIQAPSALISRSSASILITPTKDGSQPGMWISLVRQPYGPYKIRLAVVETWATKVSQLPRPPEWTLRSSTRVGVCNVGATSDIYQPREPSLLSWAVDQLLEDLRVTTGELPYTVGIWKAHASVKSTGLSSLFSSTTYKKWPNFATKAGKLDSFSESFDSNRLMYRLSNLLSSSVVPPNPREINTFPFVALKGMEYADRIEKTNEASLDSFMYVKGGSKKMTIAKFILRGGPSEIMDVVNVPFVDVLDMESNTVDLKDMPNKAGVSPGRNGTSSIVRPDSSSDPAAAADGAVASTSKAAKKKVEVERVKETVEVNEAQAGEVALPAQSAEASTEPSSGQSTPAPPSLRNILSTPFQSTRATTGDGPGLPLRDGAGQAAAIAAATKEAGRTRRPRPATNVEYEQAEPSDAQSQSTGTSVSRNRWNPFKKTKSQDTPAALAPQASPTEDAPVQPKRKWWKPKPKPEAPPASPSLASPPPSTPQSKWWRKKPQPVSADSSAPPQAETRTSSSKWWRKNKETSSTSNTQTQPLLPPAPVETSQRWWKSLGSSPQPKEPYVPPPAQ
ncbi:MAG: hypothetical protein M1825_002723 [Sarcosagium campestre]|nr:MAG: hypothetical protein M1825_002723 [Sarcosagium campestre]